MLRCVYCDILNRPEEEFYRSTMREIMLRYEKYAEFKGYKKKPETIMEFDDEGIV